MAGRRDPRLHRGSAHSSGCAVPLADRDRRIGVGLTANRCDAAWQCKQGEQAAFSDSLCGQPRLENLRHSIGDELFIPTDSGMRPTENETEGFFDGPGS